jgi:hypothetical protein
MSVALDLIVAWNDAGKSGMLGSHNHLSNRMCEWSPSLSALLC